MRAAVVPELNKRLLGQAIREEAFQVIHAIVEASRAGNVTRAKHLEKELSRLKRRLSSLGVKL